MENNEVKVDRRRQRGVVGAMVLITVGTAALLKKNGVIDPQLLRQWWSLLLIGIGGWLLVSRLNRQQD